MSERMDKLQRLGQECEQATRLQEREAIVAWLREQGQEWEQKVESYRAKGNNGPYLGQPSYYCAANAIEAGEHLKENDDAET